MKPLCKKIQEQIADLGSAALQDDKVRVHLRECQECAGVLSALDEVDGVLGRLSSPDAPASAVDRVLQKVGVPVTDKKSQPLPPLIFHVFQEGEEKISYEFTQRSILLGRGDSANLRIDDAKASKIHCVIDISAQDEMHILDLGSTNGTRINGEKVHRQTLNAGDEIMIGRTVIKFEFKELTEDEEASVSTFVETFEGYFTEDKMAIDEADVVDAKDRRMMIEVVEIWGETIIGIEHFMRPDEITIGETEKADFFVPMEYVPSDPFPLVVNEEKDYYLCFSPMMTGEIEYGDNVDDLQDLVEAGKAERREGDMGPYHLVRIHPESKCRVDIGSLTFFIQRVRPAKVVPLHFFRRQDWGFLGVLGLVLLLLLGGGTGAWLLGLINLDASLDDFSQDQDRFVRLVLQPEPPKAPPKIRMRRGKGGNKKAGEGARAKGKEGKRGVKNSKVKKAVGGAIKAARDRRIAESAGVLGALNQANADLNAVFGTGAMGGGVDAHLGGLIGTTGADQRGTFGMGLKGSGSGGGGTALGIGGLGTKGRGTGASGYGRGGGYFGKGKSDASIGIGGEETLVVGYDRRLIDMVVKRHLAQIQYCYEKELRRNPKLYGKIIVNFQFNKSGVVTKSGIRSNTLAGVGKRETGRCIAKRFRNMRFPPPKGGIVIVNYPLLFKSTG